MASGPQAVYARWRTRPAEPAASPAFCAGVPTQPAGKRADRPLTLGGVGSRRIAPASGWPWARIAPLSIRKAGEFLSLIGSNKAVEDFVDLVPRFQRLHRVEPARNIGVNREVATDQLADRDQGGAKIVRYGELIADEILPARPEPMVVEDLQPIFGALLPPGDGAGVRLVAAPLVMRKELRIH